MVYEDILEIGGRFGFDCFMLNKIGDIFSCEASCESSLHDQPQKKKFMLSNSML